MELAKVFGRGAGFAAGLILLHPIFILILGFGNAKYMDAAALKAFVTPPATFITANYTTKPTQL